MRMKGKVTFRQAQCDTNFQQAQCDKSN